MVMIHPIAPAFKNDPRRDGFADLLATPVTFNGVTVTPSILLLAGKASVADAYLEDSLTADRIVELAPPACEYEINSVLPPETLVGVTGNAGSWWWDTGTTYGDITTEDFLFEIICRQMNSADRRVIKKTDAFNGWWFGTSGGPQKSQFTFSDGGVSRNLVAAGVDDTIAYYTIGVNRDENSVDGAAMYINGVLAAQVNPVAIVGSMSNAQPLSVCYDAGAGNTSTFHFARMCKQANWFQAGAAGLAELAEFARRQTLRLFGLVQPARRASDALSGWNAYPTVF